SVGLIGGIFSAHVFPNKAHFFLLPYLTNIRCHDNLYIEDDFYIEDLIGGYENDAAASEISRSRALSPSGDRLGSVEGGRPFAGRIRSRPALQRVVSDRPAGRVASRGRR